MDDRNIAEYPPTGLEVIVVGAGFGGLTAAIECARKGHKVQVLERTPQWTQLGDIISLSGSPLLPGTSRCSLAIPRWRRAFVARWLTAW
jgi:thioredoxin reductase